MKWNYAIVSIILTAFIGAIQLRADSAALFKSKCAHCHGANGEGKPAIKAPALKGTSLSADQIQQLLTKGAPGKKGPHAKGLSALTPEDAADLASYIKSL
jgi:mono/diheme cytochrome c family protein